MFITAADILFHPGAHSFNKNKQTIRHGFQWDEKLSESCGNLRYYLAKSSSISVMQWLNLLAIYSLTSVNAPSMKRGIGDILIYDFIINYLLYSTPSFSQVILYILIIWLWYFFFWTRIKLYCIALWFRDQGSTLSFLAGCPKSHFLGWYRNFIVYCYLKLDNQVINSTCQKDKLGWIWLADDP